MYNLSDIIVTEVEQPVIVPSKKGRTAKMENRESFGLSLCIRGQITYTLGEKTYVSHPGNAVILPQGGTYTLVGDKEGLFPVINFKTDNFHCDEIIVLPLEKPLLCIQDFEDLKHSFLNNESNFKKFGIFYSLLDKVCCASKQKHTPLDAVVKFIEENIQNPELSNVMLAKQIGISEVYLRKLFTVHYNVSPKQYILDFRIKRAMQMLTETPITITDVAEKCGFSSVYHFCRAFKQRTGQTPTQYAITNRVYKI